MRAVLTLARREFTSYFTTPFGWAMLAMIQFILAYQFIGRVALYAFELEGKLQGLTAPPGVTDLVSLHLLSWSAPLFLLVVPLATMRTFSEERRQQTLPLLLSAPLHRTSLVIGKYLGAMAFLILPLLLLGAMTLSLEIATSQDIGRIVSGLLGLFFLIMATSAVGLFFSVICAHPATAALSTAGCLLFAWNLDWSADASLTYLGLAHILSLPAQLDPLFKGILSVRALGYFPSITVLFLLLTVRRLEQERRGCV